MRCRQIVGPCDPSNTSFGKVPIEPFDGGIWKAGEDDLLWLYPGCGVVPSQHLRLGVWSRQPGTIEYREVRIPVRETSADLR
jgi:hypothetical protein